MTTRGFCNSLMKGNGKARLRKAGLAAVVNLACMGSGNADQTFNLGNDQSLSLGFGLRTDYTYLQDSAPNGTSNASAFNVDDTRLYLSGQVNRWFKGTFNTERDSTGKVQMMDGFTELALDDDFNLRLGREIPPSDRSNLDGPFYLNAWSFPLVSDYPNYAIGRDNGLMAWGKPLGGKLVYSVGAFTGHNVYAGGSNAAANLLYAGRLAINFLDPEPAPAYYTASTYYGAKNILTLGLVYQYQKDGVGDSTMTAGDYNSWNADLLYEQKLADAGVVTVEGAYYHYELGAVDCGTAEPGSVPCTTVGNNIGGLVAGKAYLATLEYMFPQKIGPGNIQPFIRYQDFERDLSQTTDKQTDLGVNYVIDGHNARISAVYSRLNDTQLLAALANRNQFVLGVQFQY